jgi:transposase InsO family protein
VEFFVGTAQEGAVPWKAKSPVDLRIEFMNRVMKGERVADLCREYGISRKTGDKLRHRYKELGEAGLKDQSRAPKVIPHRTPPELVGLIVAERNRHPTWGPKKLKDVLEQRLNRVLPAASTIGEILARLGMVRRRPNRECTPARPTTLREANAPNDVWCIDYKGQFRLGDRSLCYPLTLTDQYSRYILGCEGMPAIADEAAREACEDIFHRYGLPKAMRSDNGTPFASTGLANLTQLSAYWLRLGIGLERIRPAHPEENGQHERMHRTLKAETARPPRTHLLQQQECFDDFIEEFNRERPHEAIGMKRPAQLYKPSPRKLPNPLPDPSYPEHDDVLAVGGGGLVNFRNRTTYISQALAYQYVGIREEHSGRWLVTYVNLDLGHLSKTGFTPL